MRKIGMLLYVILRMELEHVFGATNRQPKSTVWIEGESVVITATTSSLLVHHINSSNKNTCKVVRNDHPGIVSAYYVSIF